MPSSNAEKCKKYRKRKKDATLKIKKPSLTPAERSRMYRLRKKQLTQGIKSSANEVLYTPSISNSRMTFEPSPQPVTIEMKNRIEMNRNMDRKIYQASSCDALNTTVQRAQWNLQILTPIIKKEPVQSFDGEKMSHCINGEKVNYKNNMWPYKQLQSSNCVNYYDSQFCVLENVKKEIAEDECPQSSSSCINKFSVNSENVLKNEELSKVIKQENSEEANPLIKIEEMDDKKNLFIAKTEMLEEHQVLDKAGDTSFPYEVPITPLEIQPIMCDGIFKNKFHLLTHNNQHIKVEPPTSWGNEMNELHKCQCCEEYFTNHDNLLAHVRDIHNNKNSKFDLCHEGIKLDSNGSKGKKINHRRNSCERVYKSKGSDTDYEYESGAPGPSTKNKLCTEIVHKKCVTTYSREDFKPCEIQSTDNESRRLSKAPKSSAERGREFRARKALLKQQQEPDAIVEIATEDIRSAGPSGDNQIPGASEIRNIEKRAKSAEATRRWRERKKGVSESSKKQAKTTAQRMREYRERKKLAKKIPLKQQIDQDLDAIVSISSSQVNQRAGPSTINSIYAELTRRGINDHSNKF